MPSNLPSKLFTQLLDERLSSDVDMSRIHSLVKDDKTKSLNYEILYKFLESAVEEFILVNHGNPLVDDFRSKVFDKMGDVLNLLMGGTINKDDQN